jgi:hypothetical protein
MIELHSINLIKGLMLGVEYEELEGDEYLIINMLLIQIIFIW